MLSLFGEEESESGTPLDKIPEAEGWLRDS